jgi:hypothetical protein
LDAIRVGDYVKILGGALEERGRIFAVKSLEMDRVYGVRQPCAVDERGRRYTLVQLELVAQRKAES